jgi:phospholipid/cholesterol/gamma-HCH transport system permease protein
MGLAMSASHVERQGHRAVVRVRGDIAVSTARALHSTLKGLCRRRDVKTVVVDFAEVGRLDSSGVAVLGLAKKSLERSGKKLELEKLTDHHKSAFELAPAPEKTKLLPRDEEVTWLERIGDHVLATGGTLRQLGHLLLDILRQSGAVITRRKKLPTGSIGQHILLMGADAVFIVCLLSFLLGLTIAFQGVVQLEKFGAAVFVADGVGWSMIREFAPLMTAIVLTGRTGAAIAAELGTMRVNLEIDALTAMGINPTRFLIVPRMAALTFVQPALTLMGMAVGIGAGMLVTAIAIDMSPTTFWLHVEQRVTIGDVAYGLGKAFVFAWIIGISGSHLGLRATGDASSVGRATTRTVVVCIFFLVVVDAVFATVSSLLGPA